MRVKFSKEFEQATDKITKFIAKDSVERAVLFYNDLITKIEEIKYMPYRFRKNLDINDDDVRDLIFHGYVVPFYIDKEKETITILLIYKENLPSIKF